jgi:hypothetical protein
MSASEGNEVAKALFLVAKALNRQAKCAESSLELQEEMVEMQKVNLSVSRELERRLMAQQDA